MNECIFCKIATGEIPCDKLYEDDDVVAFSDINPAAPVHILIIPKKHLPTLNDIDDKNAHLIAKMHLVAKELAHAKKISAGGYRIIINCNSDAGQEVFHLHLHLLGGKPLGPMIACR
jgi:histidine triad (HIT) family protein